MKKSVLAGVRPAEFMRRHWQKAPLLCRAALTEFANAVTRDELFELASRDEVESRLVTRVKGRWRVRDGPFDTRELMKLPRRDWTLLVQGVDRAHRKAARLLQAFAFIPYARLDDVMVSYAAPGGGVGPHFDSYDVFLVQGTGTRKWRVSTQRDLDLVPGAPLKLLQNFVPQDEWTVMPGDVLYLPPACAHDGIALDECITYSVGFRAPPAEELGARFLEFLQDRLALEGRYADPQLEATRRPGRIPASLLDQYTHILARLSWSKDDVAQFAGQYLTEPAENVVFSRPRRALSATAFTNRVSASGVRLALASRMLVDDRRVFINGEAFRPQLEARRTLGRLADARELVPPLELDPETSQLLYQWYGAGYIETGSTPV
jgi:50S ribosomal protein L16 3-hydroxylase